MYLQNKRIVIVSHEYATGPSHSLEDYLSSKVKNLLFIGHPFVFAHDTRSHYRLYTHGVTTPVRNRFISFSQNQIISIMKDIVLTVIWVLNNGKFDIYVGVDNVNTFVGIFLRKIGVVKKVVFYTIDYVPFRFTNKLLNRLYHNLDVYGVRHSNIVWNLSSSMVDGREKAGLEKAFRYKQIVVPVGTESNVKDVPRKKIKRFHVVHMGHLIKKQGIQLVIEAIPLIIKKIPEFHFDIIGGGDYEDYLKALAQKLGVSKYITFYGYIQSHQEIERMLSYCAVGIAPYVDSPDSYVRYADPGKVKAYLAASLPIIITRVTPMAHEIERNRCGISIPYDKKILVKAITTLLSDDKLLSEFRRNSKAMAKEYSWNKVFDRAMEITLRAV